MTIINYTLKCISLSAACRMHRDNDAAMFCVCMYVCIVCSYVCDALCCVLRNIV